MRCGLLAPVVNDPLAVMASVEPPPAAVGSLLQLHAAPLDATLPLIPPAARPTRRNAKRARTGAAATQEPELLVELPKKLSKSKLKQLEKARARALMYERWRASLERHREETAVKREREKRLKRWFERGTDLPPHMTRPPPALPEVVRPEPAVAEKVENKLAKTLKFECGCTACRRVHHDRVRVHDQYKCRIAGCGEKFDDLIVFMEHQIDVHATVYIECMRVREEYYRCQARRVFPPATVFIVEQYMNQGELPSMWTLEQVEREAEALESRLDVMRSSKTAFPLYVIRGSFRAAYQRIKRYGISELKEQYRVALEHHEASLVHAVGPRNRQDAVSTIRAGRNWLQSIEPENADKSRAIKLQRGDDLKQTSESEDESDEEEVILEFRRAGKSNNDTENQKPASPMLKKRKMNSSDRVSLDKRKLERSKLEEPETSEESDVIFL